MDNQYQHRIKVTVEITTPEGIPQTITYEQGFLTNEELVADQMQLTPAVIEACVKSGMTMTDSRRGR